MPIMMILEKNMTVILKMQKITDVVICNLQAKIQRLKYLQNIQLLNPNMMKLFQNYLKNYHSEVVGGVFSMKHNGQG